MTHSSSRLLLGCFLAFQMTSTPIEAIDVTVNEIEVEFPESITFYLEATSTSPILSAELEYGTDTLACGESVSRAIPEDYEPDTTIEVEWNWNLRRSGSLPPGTQVWWRWVLEDSSGAVMTTPEQWITFLDDVIPWKQAQTEHLTLFWYVGTDTFAQQLLDAGEQALIRLNQMTGVAVDETIEVYIYASPEDMQAATLFAPDWSGGRAFPWDNAVIIGVTPTQLEWGMETMAHEITHVVVGHYTFSCFNSTPGWVDEGLAMVVEGEADPYFTGILQDAIDTNTLLSVREIGQIFSADPDLARLAYAESFSLVTFLLEFFGDQPMLALLDRFREGDSEDKALEAVYGFDRDGLEALWRDWIGAPPMEIMEATPTATLYPTLAPIAQPEGQDSPTPDDGEIPSAVEVEPTTEAQEDVENSKRGIKICSSLQLIGAPILGIIALAIRRFIRST
jgi:hypothetical protein